METDEDSRRGKCRRRIRGDLRPVPPGAFEELTYLLTSSKSSGDREGENLRDLECERERDLPYFVCDGPGPPNATNTTPGPSIRPSPRYT